jgi:hypothetical protein
MGEEWIGARHILYTYVSRDNHQHTSNRHPPSIAFTDGLHRAASKQ